MKKIPLSQGKFALVDDCDYDYLMQWKWCYHKHRPNDSGYATRTDRTSSRQQTVKMHRVILERMGFKNFVISDHINRDTIDNRRCNLRPAVNKQSASNRGKYKNNQSGYKGVNWHQQRTWWARIQVDGKRISLGCYNNPKEAARAYNKAALKYHGKFAVLNEV